MDEKVPATPPTVSIVVTVAPFVAELVCRTHTIWLLLIVPTALVKVAVHPIEYVPPMTEIGAAVLMPVIVDVFDVSVVLRETPLWAAKANASGVVSAN